MLQLVQSKMTFFLIPGFRESINDQAWQRIQAIITEHGHEVVLVQPSWNYHTLTDWVLDLNTIRQSYPGDHALLGFSYGAMTAFVSAVNQPAQVTILCSLSPFFQEDLSLLRPWWKEKIGKHRMTDFIGFSFDQLAKKQTGQTYLLVGQNEVPECRQRFDKALKKLLGASGEVVPEADHDIGNAHYLVSLKLIIARLS